MERKNKEQFDRIDAKNVFNQWHRDVRSFAEDLNADCVLNVIKDTEVSTFDTLNFKEVLNLTNTEHCESILNRILKEDNVFNFLKILKERDNLYPRDINRRYSVEEIYELVKKDKYHPILFLELKKKMYIIDGRTRFYCCLFNKVPAKIRIISDHKLNESCK